MIVAHDSFLGDSRYRRTKTQPYGLRSPWGIIPETGAVARWRQRMAYALRQQLRMALFVVWTLVLLLREIPRLYRDNATRRAAAFHDEDQES